MATFFGEILFGILFKSFKKYIFFLSGRALTSFPPAPLLVPGPLKKSLFLRLPLPGFAQWIDIVENECGDDTQPVGLMRCDTSLTNNHADFRIDIWWIFGYELQNIFG